LYKWGESRCVYLFGDCIYKYIPFQVFSKNDKEILEEAKKKIDETFELFKKKAEEF
jgi:hypothetical protein